MTVTARRDDRDIRIMMVMLFQYVESDLNTEDRSLGVPFLSSVFEGENGS